jgi:hypothetical protein
MLRLPQQLLTLLTNMTSRTFPIDLLRADLSTLVKALDSGVFTSEQLVQEYISEYGFERRGVRRGS